MKNLKKSEKSMLKEKLMVFDTIEEYNTYHKCEDKNSLVSLVEIKPDFIPQGPTILEFGFYGVYLIDHTYNTESAAVGKSARKEYTIAALAPSNPFRLDLDHDGAECHTTGLFFSPTLIKGSTFGRHYNEYSFFQYNHKERLVMSEGEYLLLKAIFKRIEDELQNKEDRNTLHILTDQIKLVLDYCLRFYDRQFTTMHKENYQIAQQFLQNINLYLNDGTAKKKGVPTISYFANLAHTSPGYFSDIIKRETGVNIKKYIQYKIIEAAKQMLSSTDKPINEISEWLGFKYPQHFTRLFKHEAGMSPREYRKQKK